MTVSVTANYKGERVYLSSETVWPSMGVRLRLSITPVHVGERAAHQLLALAASDVSLTDARIEE